MDTGLLTLKMSDVIMTATLEDMAKKRSYQNKKVCFNTEFDYDYHIKLYKLYRERGDAKAFNELVSQYVRLAYSVADSFQCKYLQDDLRQEAIIALMESIERWNPERGRLTTIALRIIKQRLGKFLKKVTQNDTRESNKFIYNDESERHELQFGVEEVEEVVNARIQLEKVEELVRFLHENDRKILFAYIFYDDSKNTISKVAEETGLSKPEVRYRIRKIQAFLKNPTYCTNCKRPYLRENFSRFCSDECCIQYSVQNTKIASCHICGKLFVPNRYIRSVCSMQCRTKLILQSFN